MPKSVDAMAQKMIDNMKEKTGKTLEQWLKIVAKTKIEKHMQIIKHLKAEHGLTHGYANMVAHQALNPVSQAGDDDLVEKQYSGAKAELKPIYDALVKAVEKLGADVEVSPKKSYVSIRRKKQFAIFQASTKDRLDVGLNLKGHDTNERLEASGSFNSMVSHRVRVTKKSEVNAELKKWLKEAYQAAG